jgi:hypothetical protein
MERRLVTNVLQETTWSGDWLPMSYKKLHGVETGYQCLTRNYMERRLVTNVLQETTWRGDWLPMCKWRGDWLPMCKWGGDWLPMSHKKIHGEETGYCFPLF